MWSNRVTSPGSRNGRVVFDGGAYVRTLQLRRVRMLARSSHRRTAAKAECDSPSPPVTCRGSTLHAPGPWVGREATCSQITATSFLAPGSGPSTRAADVITCSFYQLDPRLESDPDIVFDDVVFTAITSCDQGVEYVDATAKGERKNGLSVQEVAREFDFDVDGAYVATTARYDCANSLYFADRGCAGFYTTISNHVVNFPAGYDVSYFDPGNCYPFRCREWLAGRQLRLPDHRGTDYRLGAREAGLSTIAKPGLPEGARWYLKRP